METTETTRLRALCATIPEGDAVPCCADAGLSHPRSWSLGTTPMGALVRAWVDGPVQFLAAARDGIPALCDEVDRLRAELRDARADLDAQSFLRPHPSKRTGIRCARCGRDGGVDTDDDMPVCDVCDGAAAMEVERDTLRAELAETQRRTVELEAIITGRTPPPTDAEIAAHRDAGGAWLVTRPMMGRPCSEVLYARHLIEHRSTMGDTTWWVALAADGRPCAWPVTP